MNDLSNSLTGLQPVLDQVYRDMLPECGKLISVASGLAGFGALWYIAVRVWRQIANAEPIDFFPLLRPFALGLAILLFQSVVIPVLNGILQPIVLVTNSMVQNSNTAVEKLLKQKENAIKHSDAYQMYEGTDGNGDQDRWYKYTHPDDPDHSNEGVFEGIGNDVKFWLAKQNYAFRNSIKTWLSEVLQVVYAASSLCINTVRIFFLVVLAVIGPLVLGFSVFDSLQQSLVQWLARYINIFLWLPGDNNLPVELTLHLRRSQESEYYNLNKFEAVASKIPQPPAGQQYMVLTENKDKPEHPLVRSFESGFDAIEYFKKQKGTSELAVGEGPESRQLLASKEQGNTNYVNNDFRQAFFGSPVSQTFYVQKGIGFSAQQAANMVQGRTVHRDNMLNPASGEQYKAWISLDYSQPKDDYGNYKIKQMNDPNFGFDLEKTLDKFRIKDLYEPGKKESIMDALRNGDRISVTVTGKDNKEQKVQLEAQPRYKTMDFFTEQGEKLKREPFMKTQTIELNLDKEIGKAKEKGQDASVNI